MSDEDDGLAAIDARGDGELLLYDYFKHLTTLSILALGGVLTVSQIADPADVKPGMVMIILGAIAGGGVAAYGGASEIVRARYTGVAKGRSVEVSRRVAPALLATGVGMFLAMFVDSLS